MTNDYVKIGHRFTLMNTDFDNADIKLETIINFGNPCLSVFIRVNLCPLKNKKDRIQ